MRAGSDDVRTIVDLIESKADLTVVRDLDKKFTLRDDFEKQILQLDLINTIVRSDFFKARWIWKSGFLEKGGSVPWNIEIINTHPDNFLWEKDSTVVVALLSGLYEINAGFFTTRSAKIILLINDVPVLARESNSGGFLHLTAKRSNYTAKSLGIAGSNTPTLTHPDGNILAGIHLQEYFSLPAKTLISITFAGEETAQGFLGLTKLE